MNPLNPSDLVPAALLAGKTSGRLDALPVEAALARLLALPQAPVVPESEADEWGRIEPLLAEAELPKRAVEWAKKSGAGTTGDWGRWREWLLERLGAGGFTGALLGGQGTGKTALAVWLGLERMRRARARVSYTTLRSLSLRFEAAQQTAQRLAHVETRADIFAELATCGLLILDECGKGLLSPAETRLVVDLVDARHQDERDTLLLGNLTPEAFGEWAGASLMDRLNEAGSVVVFPWASFRGGKQ